MSSGKVITFYSYKGGVGRTQTLANVAVCLATWGHRVLCIDWDLEAPGLHLYFKDRSQSATSPGLADLIGDFERGETIDWHDYVRPVEAGITMMSAGRQNARYQARVQDLKWDDLYERDLGYFLEKLREEWTSNFDFVLIDSRTGISDVGGICAVQLPDIVVLMFTANEQSFKGVMKVADSAKAQRSKLPVSRGSIQFVPLASRFEGQVEKNISDRWLRRFARDTAKWYGEWAREGVRAKDLLTFLRVPYVPFWSFGEELPVLKERKGDPLSISYAFETVAALLAQHLANTDVLVSARDSFVAAARAHSSVTPTTETEGFKYHVFLSYARDNESFAGKVKAALEEMNLNVFADPGYLIGGDKWVDQSTAALQESKHFVLLAGEALTPWQKQLSTSFFALTFSEQSKARRIVPVAMERLDLSDLPPLLRQLNTIRANPRKPREAAAEIGRAVLTAKISSAEDDPQKGRWGGKAESNGRLLSAVVRGKNWFKIVLKVQSVDPSTPLAGKVTFHLHDTFNPPKVTVPVKHGVAKLELGAYGAFTVGAEADGGSTHLELDLADIVKAPPKFRKS